MIKLFEFHDKINLFVSNFVGIILGLLLFILISYIEYKNGSGDSDGFI